MITVDQDRLSAMRADQMAGAAQALLAESDVVVVRCVESGKALSDEWVAYREALRRVVRKDPSAIMAGLPARPAFPS